MKYSSKHPYLWKSFLKGNVALSEEEATEGTSARRGVYKRPYLFESSNASMRWYQEAGMTTIGAGNWAPPSFADWVAQVVPTSEEGVPVTPPGYHPLPGEPVYTVNQTILSGFSLTGIAIGNDLWIYGCGQQSNLPGVMLFSHDGGATWDNFFSELVPGGYFYRCMTPKVSGCSADAYTATVMYITRSRNVSYTWAYYYFYTSDGGNNWGGPYPVGYTQDFWVANNFAVAQASLSTIYFVPANVGSAAGNMQLLKTTSPGSTPTYVSIIRATIRPLWVSMAVSGTAKIAVAYIHGDSFTAPTYYKLSAAVSTDSGANWTTVDIVADLGIDGTIKYVRGVDIVYSGTNIYLLVAALSGTTLTFYVYESTDNGATWTQHTVEAKTGTAIPTGTGIYSKFVYPDTTLIYQFPNGLSITSSGTKLICSYACSIEGLPVQRRAISTNGGDAWAIMTIQEVGAWCIDNARAGNYDLFVSGNTEILRVTT